jgi:hypothetical protein
MPRKDLKPSFPVFQWCTAIYMASVIGYHG